MLKTQDFFTSKRALAGLGLWNVYFIAKFVLLSQGYLHFNALGNVLLMLFLLYPVASLRVRKLRTVVGIVAATILLYSESWLPGLDSLLGNASNIAGFSLSYIRELIIDFINWKMVGWGVVIYLLYVLIAPYLRVTVFTVGYFAYLLVNPFLQTLTVSTEVTTTVSEITTDKPGQLVKESETTVRNLGPADNETVQKWYRAFLDYEKERRAVLPTGLNAKDTPFDIVIMNVCSLSNDDLEASDLNNHPIFSRFNIRFDHFNSATSYSGPATLRLLNAACGQVSHDELYESSRSECQIMNRLEQLGYKQHMFLDHAGQYDNYIATMREKAGLTAPLDSTGSYPIRYVGFDDEPISDSLAVLRDWQKVLEKENNVRSVTFFNFIGLHDGNRLPRQSHWEPFKPRAKRMLDDLNQFFNELDKSGRKVMFILVPEHGAAVKGDRIQAPRLRDIPSLSITEVPVLVKFFGLNELPQNTLHVTGQTSYLALSNLIGKTLESNYFSEPTGSVALEMLIKDLPETNAVSENAQATVLRYKDRDYIRQKGDEWLVYPK